MYISKLMHTIAILSFLVRLGRQFMSQPLAGVPPVVGTGVPSPKHRFACLGVGLLAVEAKVYGMMKESKCWRSQALTVRQLERWMYR